MNAKHGEDLLAPLSNKERERIDKVWQSLTYDPSSLIINPRDRMDILMLEHRLKAERLATARVTRATWVLVAATAVLALATIALVYVTLVASGAK